LIGWSLVPQDLRFGAFLFSSFCFLYTGAIILNSKFTNFKWVFAMGFLICSLNIIPILLYFTQKSLITREIIGTIFISNFQESKEYVWANFSYLHLSVIVVFIAVSYLLFVNRKEGSSERISISLFCLFIVSFFVSCLSGPIGALSSEYGSYLYQKKKLKDMIELRAKGLSESNFTIDKEVNHATKIVIVIGESLNRSYMSLYGYGRNTTPYLSRLAIDSTKNGRLFVFDNVISPEVYTVPALEKVLTNTNNENDIPFDKSISLVDFFEKAGFETYWISNQAPLGKNDTPISVISSSADSVYFSLLDSKQKLPISVGSFYDGVILDPFKNLVKNNVNDNQVYFIHLMGSHVNYEDRYPSNFNIFKTKEINSTNLYLNSIRYNDWVVNNIIEIGNANDVDVVCYFSDHGDELGFGHNPSNYKKGMSLIPFMVYLSKEYSNRNPELVKQLKNNKTTPAMTDNFFNDIQVISGIKGSIFESENSFISKDYRFKKRMVVDKKIPFD